MTKLYFSENLRNIRKSLKMSQEELGNAINTSKQTIYKYEKGESLPPLDKFIDIAQFLGASCDELLLKQIDAINKHVILDKATFDKYFDSYMLQSGQNAFKYVGYIYSDQIKLKETVVDMIEDYPRIEYIENNHGLNKRHLSESILGKQRKKLVNAHLNYSEGILNISDWMRITRSMGAHYDFQQLISSTKLTIDDHFIILCKLATMCELNPKTGKHELTINQNIINIPPSRHEELEFQSQDAYESRQILNNWIMDKYNCSLDSNEDISDTNVLLVLTYVKLFEKELPNEIADLYHHINSIQDEMSTLIQKKMEQTFLETLKDIVLGDHFELKINYENIGNEYKRYDINKIDTYYKKATLNTHKNSNPNVYYDYLLLSIGHSKIEQLWWGFLNTLYGKLKLPLRVKSKSDTLNEDKVYFQQRMDSFRFSQNLSPNHILDSKVLGLIHQLFHKKYNEN